MISWMLFFGQAPTARRVVILHTSALCSKVFMDGALLCSAVAMTRVRVIPSFVVLLVVLCT